MAGEAKSRPASARPGWSRRQTLGAMAALGAVPALPALGGALPEAGLLGEGFPQDALHAFSRQVTVSPEARHVGALCAGPSDAWALEAALRARIPAARTEAEWRAALLDCARADIAAGRVRDVEGRNVFAVEALLLGLGTRLRETDAVA